MYIHNRLQANLRTQYQSVQNSVHYTVYSQKQVTEQPIKQYHRVQYECTLHSVRYKQVSEIPIKLS